MNKPSQTCFFCNKKIEEKKTLEHVIPNALLGHLGIKEEVVTGSTETQYSRVKVPAHSSCNSGFGSKYESEVIDLLKNPDNLYEMLKSEEDKSPQILTPNKNSTSLITTWLSKIYYGFFYNDFLKTDKLAWKKVCKSIINSHNFDLIRKSYQENIGFSLPSSLYCFRSKNEDFDFITQVYPQAILIKIKSLTFILCVCDGFLTRQYLWGETLNQLQEELYRQEDLYAKEGSFENFPFHRYVFADVVATLKCIPKAPSFAYSENQIMNMSLMTLARDPQNLYKINLEDFMAARKEIQVSLNIA
jgi:hypothetical protein